MSEFLIKKVVNSMNKILDNKKQSENTSLFSIACKSIDFIKENLIKNGEQKKSFESSENKQANNYYDLIKIVKNIQNIDSNLSRP